jgi:hypothetical protein
MDFLKNINRDFILSPEFDFIKKQYHYLFEPGDKIIMEDVIISVDDIDRRLATFYINSIGNIDDVVNQVVAIMEKSLTKDADKFKVLANRVIKAWEETPNNFVKHRKNFLNNKTIYENKGLLVGEEYNLSVFVFIDKISYHSDFSFTSGYGRDTYYEKDFYVNCMNEIDPWITNTVKELNSAKVKKRIKNQLLKNRIVIPLTKLEKFLTLADKTTPDKDSVKPPFPMSFTDDEINFLLSYIGECYISENLIEELSEEGFDISSLLDWEISYEHEGEHHNDGQICDYTITFTSPDGYEYYAYDSHSLMTGWNFNDEVIIE